MLETITPPELVAVIGGANASQPRVASGPNNSNQDINKTMTAAATSLKSALESLASSTQKQQKDAGEMQQMMQAMGQMGAKK
jgi:ABC-type molybdate transport system substrate-binding protein